jgi:hypothetical protein
MSSKKLWYMMVLCLIFVVPLYAVEKTIYVVRHDAMLLAYKYTGSEIILQKGLQLNIGSGII